jgi:hypothetical protein
MLYEQDPPLYVVYCIVYTPSFLSFSFPVSGTGTQRGEEGGGARKIDIITEIHIPIEEGNSSRMRC